MSNPRDPFGEHTARTHTRRARVLGADIQFNTDSRELLALVDEAFADGPRHRVNGHVRQLRIDLRLVGESSRPTPVPRMRLRAGAGFLHGALDRDNFATLAPAQGTALVVVSRPMLAHAHLVRYELIEFAALTLAARAQGLVPLHAACVARGRRGVLLLGDSGAGKSTLSLLAAAHGLRVIGEDNVFVAPATLAATGLANFLHVRSDAAHLFDETWKNALRSSARIRRRSGVRKIALDLRRRPGALAARSPRLSAVIWLSREARTAQPLLSIGPSRLRQGLRLTQP
ncbi:MAG TPA: hypothetical protein VFZ95_09195, partial [Steroidobacteraceae bacterium]